mgnify:CR=1 FL=1
MCCVDVLFFVVVVFLICLMAGYLVNISTKILLFIEFMNTDSICARLKFFRGGYYRGSSYRKTASFRDVFPLTAAKNLHTF